jgi:hypothetical protein
MSVGVEQPTMEMRVEKLPVSGALAPLRRPGVPMRAPEPEPPPPAGACGNLAAALSAARDKCKPAALDATNTFHKYDYASAEEILRVGGEALKGSGLAVVPVSSQLTVLGDGSATIHALDRDLLLIHSSGESLPLRVRGWPVIPDRGRPLDKAFASALTTSLSYLYRDLLQMPRVDPADDMAGREDRPAPKPKQPENGKSTAPAGAITDPHTIRHAASAEQMEAAKAALARQQPSDKLSIEQERELSNLLEKTGTPLAALLETYHVESLATLPYVHYGECLNGLKRKAAAQAKVADIVKKKGLRWVDVEQEIKDRWQKQKVEELDGKQLRALVETLESQGDAKE